MNDDKPSYKTTEFLVTLVTSLLSFAVFMGWVPQTDMSTLNGTLVEMCKEIGVLVVNAVAIWQYIKSRTEVKKVRETLRVESLKLESVKFRAGLIQRDPKE